MPTTSDITLWTLTRSFRWRYIAAIFAMAVGTLFLLAEPYLLKVALDELWQNEAASLWSLIVPAAVGMTACRAAHGFFTYLRGKWAAQASEGVVRSLRRQLYRHLERLPCTFHDGADTGDLIQRCSSDVETVRVFLSAQVVEIARITLLLSTAIPLMLWQNVLMSGLALVTIPFLIAYAFAFFRHVRALYLRVEEAEGRLTTILQENLTGVRVVRAFARQGFEIEKFREQNQRFRDDEYRLFRALARYWAISEIVVFLQLGLVLFAGGYLVTVGQISPGTWLLFWWLLRTIIWPIRHLGRVLADSGKATVAIQRMREILEEPEESSTAQGVMPPCADIEFRDVTFAYSNGQRALDHFSLTIRSGETIAILGRPGSGKSSLIQLLLRLYEYEQGTILIGGKELQTIDRDSVRHTIGSVLQDPFLYAKTVSENIAFGVPGATPDAIEQVARTVHLHDDIMRLRDGYDTEVGERGVTLSGGQRQRLAIARALLKNPPLLVLDDSLSAVDTTTERAILKNLAHSDRARTTLIVTHRLSLTRHADRIIYMEQGRVVQDGTHAELRASPGPFQAMWQIDAAVEQDRLANVTAPQSPAPDTVPPTGDDNEHPF